MSLFEGFFGENRQCFGLFFGFSVFEEIENAFVRGFLQGGCLKSAVLDMPFYCEMPLGSESVSVGDGGRERERENRFDEVCYNWFGGSDFYFDNASHNRFDSYSDNVSLSCFNDYSDNGSHSRFNDFSDRGFVYCCDFIDGSNGSENGKICRNVYEGGYYCGRNYVTESVSCGRQFDWSEKEPVLDVPVKGVSVISDDRFFGTDLAGNGDFVTSDYRVFGADLAGNGGFVTSDYRTFGADLAVNGSSAVYDDRFFGTDLACNWAFVTSDYRAFGADLDVNEVSVVSDEMFFGMTLAVNRVSVVSDDRALNTALTVNGMLGGISSVNLKDRIYSSLFLNVYKSSDLKAYPNLLLTGRDFDVSLSCEGFYRNEVGFAKIYFDFMGADKFGEDSGRKWNIFIGEADGRAFDFSENGGDVISAAGVIEFRGGLDKGCWVGCGCDFDCKADGGYEFERRFADFGYRYKPELPLADRGCRCEGELRFAEFDCGLKAWDNHLFADIGFILNGEAERSVRQGLSLRNENLGLGKIALLLKSGKENFESGFYRARGEALLNDRFDFIQEKGGFLQEKFNSLQEESNLSQEKNVRFSAFDRSWLSAEFQRTELLWENSFKAGFGKLRAGLGAVMLSAGGKENETGRGRLFLREDELCISPEEIGKIRRAISTEYCAEPVKAEIRVDMSGMKNIINRETDIDSIVADLTAAVSEAVASAAEGVHGL